MADKRPDLAKLIVNDPFSYVGGKVFPVLKQGQKVDEVYFVTPTADAAAQTGRTLGAAPTSATMATAHDTATTTEIIDRVLIPDDEIPRWGGTVDAAQKLAAIVGKRNVMRAIEDRQVAQALNASITGQDILDSLLGAIDDAIDAVHTVPGRVCGACGWSTFRRMCRYSEVTNTLLRTIVGGSNTDAAAVRRVSIPLVADLLGLQELFVGDSDHWTAGSLCIFKQVNPDMLPFMEPQVGRTVTYWPQADDGEGIEVETYHDDNLKAEVVDVRTWNVVKRFASRAGMYILKGIDEGNASTTTTTTVTTTT